MPPSIRVVGGLGLLIAIALLPAVAFSIFMLRPAVGIIIIDHLPENAVVKVDDEEVADQHSTGEILAIERAAGKHVVVVNWRDAPSWVETVTLQPGKQVKLTAPFDPPILNAKKSPVESASGAIATEHNQRSELTRPDPPDLSVKRPTVSPSNGSIAIERDLRTKSKATPALANAVAKSSPKRSIQGLLEMPIPMKYPKNTPLEDVLKNIKAATRGTNDSGIPIYVDPTGLRQAKKSLASSITINVENRPLKTTLPLILKQLGLINYVADGLLIITSVDRSIDEELRYLGQSISTDASDQTKAIVAKLDEPIPMLFCARRRSKMFSSTSKRQPGERPRQAFQFMSIRLACGNQVRG